MTIKDFVYDTYLRRNVQFIVRENRRKDKQQKDIIYREYASFLEYLVYPEWTPPGEGADHELRDVFETDTVYTIEAKRSGFILTTKNGHKLELNFYNEFKIIPDNK